MTSRMITAVVTVAVSTFASAAVAAPAPKTMPVWPKLDPALKASEKTEDHAKPGQKSSPFIRDVKYPTMTVYLPDGAKGPTPAVVICPGGGYAGVAIVKEGKDVAKWLNTLGVAGVVLKYRMPRVEETKTGTPLPLLDAREALRLTREHAGEWNVDVKRVGIMGFSAGGHLASTVITHPSDDEKARADFAVLLYPVISMAEGVTHKGSRQRLIGEKPDSMMVEEYSNELHVRDKTVPTFIAQAGDDHVSPANSLLFYEALRSHHVPAELHLFEKGGHGFGLGEGDGEVAMWPALCANWMRTQKILPAK